MYFCCRERDEDGEASRKSYSASGLVAGSVFLIHRISRRKTDRLCVSEIREDVRQQQQEQGTRKAALKHFVRLLHNTGTLFLHALFILSDLLLSAGSTTRIAIMLLFFCAF